MMFPKIVAMKCDTDFIPSQDRDMANILLWTANIRHGLFRRQTDTARSFDGIIWRIVGPGEVEPGLTVWSMLVERCAAMKDTGLVSWTTRPK